MRPYARTPLGECTKISVQFAHTLNHSQRTLWTNVIQKFEILHSTLLQTRPHVAERVALFILWVRAYAAGAEGLTLDDLVREARSLKQLVNSPSDGGT
jgi:hypothetical protein